MIRRCFSLAPVARISILLFLCAPVPGSADHFAVSPVPQPEARRAALRDLAPRHQLPLLPQDGYALRASILVLI